MCVAMNKRIWIDTEESLQKVEFFCHCLVVDYGATYECLSSSIAYNILDNLCTQGLLAPLDVLVGHDFPIPRSHAFF